MNFEAGVLILDEPTIGLDQMGFFKLLQLIETLSAAGTAVIAITHDSVLTECANRILTMKNGRIIREQASAAPRVTEQSRSASTID